MNYPSVDFIHILKLGTPSLYWTCTPQLKKDHLGFRPLTCKLGGPLCSIRRFTARNHPQTQTLKKVELRDVKAR